MQSSVTLRSTRIGRSARSVRSRADDSATTGGALSVTAPYPASSPAASLAGDGDGLELIHAPEVQVPRDEHLDAIALRFHDGRRNVNGRLQHLRHHLAGDGRIHNERVALLTLRLNARLHGAVDHAHEHRRPEPLEEM